MGPGTEMWSPRQNGVQEGKRVHYSRGRGNQEQFCIVRKRRKAQQKGFLNFRSQEGWGERKPLGLLRIYGSRGD